MGVIGFHLWHGFWSAFQSLGVGDARTTERLIKFGKAVAVVIAGGFLIIPLYLFLNGARP
jgi:succinate dehydrogenase / fumarate reductase cytochrome b subunit